MNKKDNKNTNKKSNKKPNKMTNKVTDSAKKNVTAKPKLKLPQGWFYMSEQETTAQQIAQCLGEAGYDVEVWIEAGVVEVTLGEKSSMDFESFELPFEEEFSDAFVAEHGLQSAFYVKFQDEVYEQAKKVASTLRAAFGGGLYGDTDDFMPML